MNISSLNDNIFVAGHGGMVGSAIVKELKNIGYRNIITAERRDLDLLDCDAVDSFFKNREINLIYFAAAKVGGIHANSNYPAEYIYENLHLQNNVIHSAHKNNISKLLFLGSSCIYPKHANQPIREEALLTGALEVTNEPYAIAKIAGIKLCESYFRQYNRDYRTVMPTNLYGPHDNYHIQNSHVVPALIRRFHEAVKENFEEIIIWGSGNVKREFLHVDDMAAASIFVMNLPKSIYWSALENKSAHINIGTGNDCTIRTLAEIIAEISGFTGKIIFDENKPEGTPRKLLDVRKINNLGWKSTINLEDGLRNAYEWYQNNLTVARF